MKSQFRYKVDVMGSWGEKNNLCNRVEVWKDKFEQKKKKI